MNWEAVGAIAETIGGIAVLITILYLAFQIKQTQISMKANIRQRISELAWEFSQSVYNSPYMPQIFMKVANEVELNPEEAARFFCLSVWFALHL